MDVPFYAVWVVGFKSGSGRRHMEKFMDVPFYAVWVVGFKSGSGRCHSGLWLVQFMPFGGL